MADPAQYLDLEGLQYYTDWLRKKILNIKPINTTTGTSYTVSLSGNERAHIIPDVDKPVNITFTTNNKRDSTITQEVYFKMGSTLKPIALISSTPIKWVKSPIFNANKTYLISVTITNVNGTQYPVGMFVEMD